MRGACIQENCTTLELFEVCSTDRFCKPDDSIMFSSNVCCCNDVKLTVGSREKCANCISDSWVEWTSTELTECLMSLVPEPPAAPSLPYLPRYGVSVLPDECLLCLVADAFTCSVASHYSIDWADCDESCWRKLFIPNQCLQTASACIANGQCQPLDGVSRHLNGPPKTITMTTHAILTCLLMLSSILNVLFALSIYRGSITVRRLKVLRTKKKRHVSGGGDGGIDGGGNGGPVV